MANRNAVQEREALTLLQSGFWQIDEDGAVWRVAEMTRVGRTKPVEPRRADKQRQDGYCWVRFRRGSHVMAHRLVWMSRHGWIPDEIEINHKNGVRWQNDLGNLEELTPSGNSQHAYDELNRVRAAGESNGRHKVTAAIAAEIRRRQSGGESGASLGREFGISRNAANRIARGALWRDEFPTPATVPEAR